MILKTLDEGKRWHLYDDVHHVDFKIMEISGKKEVHYSVMRRRGFDFNGKTSNLMYILNDEGKTIEKLN